jgi:uncharacterized protein (TIGR04255 family)
MVKGNQHMARERHLKNAPIREALVDIAVKVDEHINLAALKSLSERISSEYPKTDELVEASFQVEFKKADPPTFAKKGLGFACQNAEGNRIVQFRFNGFTYNWLKPYSTWEDLRSAAQRYWQMYVDAVRPISVTRLALRYINNVALPLPFDDFGEYLPSQPHVPPELPQELGHFLTRVGLQDNETEINAVVTQVFEGVVKDTEVPIILDIDTSKSVNLKHEEDDVIWRTFEQLRTFKNRIFFASLTEKAVRLFE